MLNEAGKAWLEAQIEQKAQWVLAYDEGGFRYGRWNPKRRYRQYSDMLDVLAQHQVTTTLILLLGVLAFLLFQKTNCSYLTFK